MLELALRSALAHSATVARANISHQQLAYQKFRTWAAMVTHKLGNRDTWLTAAMCDTLQLARVSQHRSMKQWRQESLEEVRACMSRWLMEHQAWVEEIAERWSVVRERKKRPASAVDLSPGRRFKRYRTHHPDTPDYIQLTGNPDPTDLWEIQLTGSLSGSLPTHLKHHTGNFGLGSQGPWQSRRAHHCQPTCGISCPQRRPQWTCTTRMKPVAIVITAGLMLGNLPMSAFSLFIVRL